MHEYATLLLLVWRSMLHTTSNLLCEQQRQRWRSCGTGVGVIFVGKRNDVKKNKELTGGGCLLMFSDLFEYSFALGRA